MSGKKRVRKRIALLFAVIFAFSLTSYFYFSSGMFVKVNCVTPVVTNKTICVTGLGYLKEVKRTGYYFDIPVKVEQVYVKVGDNVKAGDPLLKINLTATKLAVKMAAAGIFSRENKSIEAANTIDYSKMGSGDVTEILAKIPETVYAAYDCVISGVTVQSDEYSNPYSPLITMSDRSILCAEVTVDERDAKDLEIGQKAVISGSALGKEYVANVVSVAARATLAGSDAVTSNKVDVKLELLGTDDTLVINSLVRADIALGIAENVIIAPYEAVNFSDQGDYVFINQNGTAVKKNVITGRTFEDGIEIVSGLAPDDRIVLSAKGDLTEGAKVKE